MMDGDFAVWLLLRPGMGALWQYDLPILKIRPSIFVACIRFATGGLNLF